MGRNLKLIATMLAFTLLFSSCAKNEESSKVEENNEKEVATQSEEMKEYSLADTKFLDELETKNVELEFKKTEVSPKVPEYKIESDLSNITNIEYFGDFTNPQQESLVKNGFVITKTGNQEGYEGMEYKYDQIHQIYEANEYEGIPSFITTDSVTHMFHIFYTNFLRNLEEKELYPKLADFNKKLLDSNIKIYNELEDEETKNLQLKNIAMLATGVKLSGEEPENLPEEANNLYLEELKNIENEASADSMITDRPVDYSQLKPRGHYTRSEELEKYFKNTMYYGQVGFFVKQDEAFQKNDILQSLLLTYSIYSDPETLKTWENLVSPIDFLVETADDLSIREYSRILYGVYGKDLDINNLNNEDYLANVYLELDKLKEPQIASYKGKSFRLIPQRAVLDNVLMQNVVDVNRPSTRPIYSGLDLMSSFNNKKATEIQKNDPYNSHFKEYNTRIEENQKYIESMTDKDWQKNLYRGWLWMLSSYNKEYGEGYPIFMQNEDWMKKDLVSALGSYAELKHDTLLYGKAVMAEMGGFEEPDWVSYVEPNVELYDKLSWLIEYTQLNLKDRQMIDGEFEEKLSNFKELVDFLRDMSVKELNNEILTKKENLRLAYIGGEMERAMLNFVEDESEFGLKGWYEIENPADRRMPVVADLMSVVENTVNIPEGEIFSIASGKPAEIYVVYPVGDKLYMGRGGVFTYYEFTDKECLTDEKWQEMVMEDKKDYPEWYRDIIKEEKSKLPGNPRIMY